MALKKQQPIVFDSEDTDGSDLSYESSFDERLEKENDESTHAITRQLAQVHQPVQGQNEPHDDGQPRVPGKYPAG